MYKYVQTKTAKTLDNTRFSQHFQGLSQWRRERDSPLASHSRLTLRIIRKVTLLALAPSLRKNITL